MILASKSPRRLEIISEFGINVTVKSKDIVEESNKEKIFEQIEDIAEKKAIAVSKDESSAYILAADTVVVYKNRVLGKPKDIEEAREMLASLSGERHMVISAYAFLNIEKNIRIIGHQKTEVTFKKLTKEDIEWYISTKEPMDKAGSYGVQGKGAILIESIDGDFYNVMGFPISKFVEDLKKNGFKIDDIIKL